MTTPSLFLGECHKPSSHTHTKISQDLEQVCIKLIHRFMAKNLLGMHRVADTDRLKQLLKMARVLLNVNRVLIHQRVDALEKFKGITGC